MSHERTNKIMAHRWFLSNLVYKPQSDIGFAKELIIGVSICVLLSHERWWALEERNTQTQIVSPLKRTISLETTKNIMTHWQLIISQIQYTLESDFNTIWLENPQWFIVFYILSCEIVGFTENNYFSIWMVLFLMQVY